MIRRQSSRNAGSRLIVAASEKDANLLYATRFFAPDPFIYFTSRGKSFLVMSDLEIDRARKQARVNNILSLSDVMRSMRKSQSKTFGTPAILAELFTRRRIQTVEIPWDFPTEFADQLRKVGFQLKISAGDFFPERQIKTSEEIRAIQKAQQVAEAGMHEGIELIRRARIASSGFLVLEGSKLTSERVKYRIAETILREGHIATHTIVSGGRQACDPHEEGHGPLRAHQPIILDIFPRSQQTGYWGDITRTVIKGRISETLARLYETVLEGQKTALEEIKEGVGGNLIHQSVANLFMNRGFKTGRRKGRMEGFFHGTGHGVGLEIHELPRLSTGASSPLKAGHIVTVEPGLYYPELGGVRIEDLVLVTKGGYRNLTRFPKIFKV
ncbi:MAG: Xaa-Pro peptidase family protein [Terriglobia bacterium]